MNRYKIFHTTNTYLVRDRYYKTKYTNTISQLFDNILCINTFMTTFEEILILFRTFENVYYTHPLHKKKYITKEKTVLHIYIKFVPRKLRVCVMYTANTVSLYATIGQKRYKYIILYCFFV